MQVDLAHAGDGWTASERVGHPGEWSTADPRPVGEAEPFDLELSRKLAEYSRLMKPRSGRGRLVFINLQKRLLSSVEAFYRTLELHSKSVGAPRAGAEPNLFSRSNAEQDEYGLDEETEASIDASEIEASSRSVESPEGQARTLLDALLRTAEQCRAAPDAKVLALVDWIRGHQCPGVQVGGATGSGAALRWSDRRVIVFTEFTDTKRFLFHILNAAVAGTDQGDFRIMQFHGGMSDDQRDEVQTAFNGPPERYPVRILIATDAAREGVNLQGYCADLFHFDVPWNPARMEQRNGRIDRTLQSEPEVRCHYFFYPQRPEDIVLRTLVEKVERIQKELGSLGAVVMDRFERILDDCIDERTGGRSRTALAVPTWRTCPLRDPVVRRSPHRRRRGHSTGSSIPRTA